MNNTQTLIAKLVTGQREVEISHTGYPNFYDEEEFLIRPIVCDYTTNITELTDAQRLAIVALTTNDKSAWAALCDYLQETLTRVSNE